VTLPAPGSFPGVILRRSLCPPYRAIFRCHSERSEESFACLLEK
jgi:hypothetical protein